VSHFNWGVIVVYLLANFLVGMLAGGKTKGFTNFAVGNRNFNSAVIFCTLSATFIGGGYTIGNAGKVFSSGMVYAFALLGFSVKEILVGLVIAPRMKHFQDCVSVGDVIAKSYGRIPQVITGVFSILICVGILSAQISALGVLSSTLVPGYTGNACVIISFLLVMVYCMVGGMRAVVYTDVIQFFVLAIGIPLLFFLGLHAVGGWSAITAKIPLSNILPFSSLPQLSLLISLFVTFMLGEVMVPPYVQRLFMGNPKATRLGTVASGLFSIPFFLITGAIGLVAYTYDPSIAPNLALPSTVLYLAPVMLKGFMFAALLAIIMSSASGFLNTTAVTVVTDIIKPLAPDYFGSKALLRIAKVMTLLVGLTAVFFALGLANALDILLFSYNLWSPIILVPLVAAIFQVKSRAIHYYCSAGAGFIGAMVWMAYTNEDTFINSVTFGILMNLLCFVMSRRFIR
jgi:solute:Na+ symporter, SSS family